MRAAARPPGHVTYVGVKTALEEHAQRWKEKRDDVFEHLCLLSQVGRRRVSNENVRKRLGRAEERSKTYSGGRLVA